MQIKRLFPLTIFLPLVGLLLLATTPVQAVELEPVIVTASRTAQTVDETLAPVTVITRDDIERSQARSIQDLLRGVPGVSFSNNGGAGKNTSLFLRGAESDHVLVLIDGMRVGSATTGTTSFQHIPLQQIERIEIVRGPRSSLYGSEAIGGVIQIFTRKGGGELSSFAAVGGGSYRTFDGAAGVSGGGKQSWFNVSGNFIETDGFNACTGKPFPGGAGCFTNEPDKDGYRNLSGSARVGGRIGDLLEVDLRALRTLGRTRFDGGFQNEASFVQQVLGGTVKLSPGESWQMTLSGGRSQDESNNAKDSVFSSSFDTVRDSISLQNDMALADDHLLTVGADFRDDKVAGTTAYSELSRNNTGVFAQYLGTVRALDTQLSGRWDDDEAFGARFTGGISVGWAVSTQDRLIASYGTAYKAPTFNELYFPGFGNSALKPEKSRSMELEFRHQVGRSHWTANVYETRIHNLISFDASISAPNNIEEARIRGLELGLTTEVRGWQVASNVTILDPQNHGGNNSQGNLLPRRARKSARVQADRGFGPWALGATIRYADKRYDDLNNSRQLAQYTTLDLRGEYRICEHLRLQVRGENLFNQRYETASFFTQPGRSGYITLRFDG